MYGDQTSQEVAKITNGEYGKIIDNEISYFKSLFNRDKGNEPNHLGVQQTENTGAKDHLGMDVKKSDSMGADFWSSIGDFFKGVVEGVKNDNEVRADFIRSNNTDSSLNAVDVGNSGINPITGQMIPTPPMTDFNISDMLPDFNLSEWLAEKTADIDLESMLPDFSAVGEMIGEQLNVIPEKISEIGTSIGEGFSQIPTAASEAFSTISNYANEGLTTIQTTWNELPSFFDGLFAGLGGVATSAGAAIASGSLASMASNAASTIMSFGGGGGVGHNATGTASWRGGFTEVNEQGGEIIDLPSGARIYPHATTMKMLQSDLKAGRLDEMIQSSGFGLATPAAFEYDELGNIKGYSGMADNLIQEGDLSPIREAKLQAQREFMSLSAFPQEIQTPELSAFPQAFDSSEFTRGITNNSTSNSTTQTNTNNNGITITGNNFNIRKESDIDEIVFKLFNLLFDSNANFGGA